MCGGAGGGYGELAADGAGRLMKSDEFFVGEGFVFEGPRVNEVSIYLPEFN